VCVCVFCRSDVVSDDTAFASTPSTAVNSATLPRPLSTPDNSILLAGETKVPGGSSESKMTEAQLEEMCAEYGGYLRARWAATVIQQTYRQYSMSRSFAKLRLEAGESRRSQRFLRRRGADGFRTEDSADVDRSLDLSRLCGQVGTADGKIC